MLAFDTGCCQASVLHGKIICSFLAGLRALSEDSKLKLDRLTSEQLEDKYSCHMPAQYTYEKETCVSTCPSTWELVYDWQNNKI